MRTVELTKKPEGGKTSVVVGDISFMVTDDGRTCAFTHGERFGDFRFFLETREEVLHLIAMVDVNDRVAAPKRELAQNTRDITRMFDCCFDHVAEEDGHDDAKEPTKKYVALVDKYDNLVEKYMTQAAKYNELAGKYTDLLIDRSSGKNKDE